MAVYMKTSQILTISPERLAMKKDEAAAVEKLKAEKLAQQQFMADEENSRVIFPEAA